MKVWTKEDIEANLNELVVSDKSVCRSLRIQLGMQAMNAEFCFATPTRLLLCRNKEKCTLLLSCLTSLGTDYLLNDQFDMAACVANACLKLTHIHTGNVTSDYVTKSAERISDIYSNTERESLKFFYKRIKCQCLKENWKQTKEQKTGECSYCGDIKESRELFLCKGCRMPGYCSEECQRAAWPSHKAGCLELQSNYAEHDKNVASLHHER